MTSARIVLCLHDELVIHVPQRCGAEVAQGLDDWLQEAAYRWLERPTTTGPPGSGRVRFVVDVSVIARWSDAK